MLNRIVVRRLVLLACCSGLLALGIWFVMPDESASHLDGTIPTAEARSDRSRSSHPAATILESPGGSTRDATSEAAAGIDQNSNAEAAASTPDAVDCVEPFGDGGAAIKSGKRVAGLREGLWRVYYPDGTLWSEETFKSNKLHGLVRSWAPDGHLTGESEYQNGKLHGTVLGYFPDGSIWTKRTYSGGKEFGPWIVYARDGSVLAQGVASPETPSTATSQIINH